MENITEYSSCVWYKASENVTVRQNTMENNDSLTTIPSGIEERRLPVAVILYLLFTIGIIGNIITILYYVHSPKRTPPTLLITCLAVADLGMCLIGIPVVSEVLINVKYSLTMACKFVHFFGHWAGACSCSLLWLISIDRCRKICYPLAKQMTTSTVKYLVVGVTSFTLLKAVPHLVTFDSVELTRMVNDSNTTVKGHYCIIIKEYKCIALVFYAIDILFLLMILITVIVTYSKIIYVIVKRRVALTNSLPSQQNCRNVEKCSSSRNKRDIKYSIEEENDNAHINPTRNLSKDDGDIISISERKADETDIFTIAKRSMEHTKTQCIKSEKHVRGANFEYTRIRNPSEVKLSLMMFTVSMIFILCFTPYFAIRIFITVLLDSKKDYDFNAGLQFAIKLPYINSVFNPIVYYIFNPNFRRYIFGCFGKCWRSLHI
jgi:hypothetical protein